MDSEHSKLGELLSFEFSFYTEIVVEMEGKILFVFSCCWETFFYQIVISRGNNVIMFSDYGAQFNHGPLQLDE